MPQNFQYDWLDGIFVSVFFGLGIVLYEFMPGWSLGMEHLSVLGLFGGPVIRRALFGAPQLPPAKEGAGWRLISILGLLIIFFSMAMFWMSAIAFEQSNETMPMYRAEVEQREKELQEMLGDISPSVVVPAGTPQEEIDRLIQLEVDREAKESKQRVESRIKELEDDFIMGRKERFQDGLDMAKWALLMCLFGSGCLRLRYPLRSSEH
jgi:hypothetical protein